MRATLDPNESDSGPEREKKTSEGSAGGFPPGPGVRVYCCRVKGRRDFMLQVRRRTLSGTEVRLEEARCACKHQVRSRTSATLEGQHRSALSAARSHLGVKKRSGSMCTEPSLEDGGRGMGVCGGQSTSEGAE